MKTLNLKYAIIAIATSTIFAFAAVAQNASVEIDKLTSTEAIQTAIATALATNDVTTVTVTGEFDNPDRALTISIPPGKEVIWQAQYVFNDATGINDPLLQISGAGEFQLAAGATVKANNNVAIRLQ